MRDPDGQQDPPVAPASTPWWLLLSLYALCVAVLALLARQVTGPLDVDGSYYFLVARNLAQGRGLVVDALWHFFHPSAVWPQPAGDLWVPLSSFLMAPALLFGETFRYAQAAQVLLAALLPLLAYRIARDEGLPVAWASLAGLATLFAGTVSVHWLDTDCFTAYALVGGAALYAMGRSRQEPRWLLAAGLLGGLAAITRNDGALLLVVLWLTTWLFNRHGRRPFPWRPLLLATALFLLPVLCWMLRNVLVFGRPSPVPATFFLTMVDYGQLFTFRPLPDWAAFWSQGWETFFTLRLRALQASLVILAQDLQVWEIVLLVVAVTGLRRRPGLWPAFLYLAILFLTLNMAFPLLVLHGTWSRSLTAFLPTGYACVALGLWHLVERLLRWRPALPARLVRATFLAFGAILIVLIGWSAMAVQLQSARAYPRTWQQVGEWLRKSSTSAEEVIMAQDPMAVAVHAGRRAIGVPNEEPPLLLDIAHEYGVGKVVLIGSLGLLPRALQELYASGTSQEPFTLLWRDGEIRIYGLEGP